MSSRLTHLSRREMLTASSGLMAGFATTRILGPAGSGPLAELAPRTSGVPLRPGGALPVAEIEEIMQTKGKMHDGVLVLSLVRKDLHVTGPNGHVFQPPFAPNHNFFFQSLENGEAFMNAEFAYTPAELNRTMDAVLGTPLQLMAQHQHYIGERPQLFHYHFRGRGKPTDVARWAMTVVRATGTPLPQPPEPNPRTPLPHDELASIIGGNAEVMADGVVEVSVTRPNTFVEDGVQLLPQMNVLHKIDFEPLDPSGRRANVGADYAMLSGEINPALEQARKSGFEIHCLYNQQTAIEPSLFFSHTLQAGDSRALAHEVRRVLDVIHAASHVTATRGSSH